MRRKSLFVARLIWGQIGDGVASALRLRPWPSERGPAYDPTEAIVMASLEQRGSKFRLVFRYGGQKYQHPLKTHDPTEAEECRCRLEENLRLLRRGRLALPAGSHL